MKTPRFWRRRYLTLDKYMTGNFLRLFGWTFFLSALAFLVLWFILWGLFGHLSLGDAFIQLTNPQRHNEPMNYVPGTEWWSIVIMNLFGLFVLNGVVLTLLVNWVSNRRDKHDKGLARYDYIFEKKFSVILGGHKIVASLARDLMTNGENEYLLIQTQSNVEKLRKEIAAEINDEKITERIIIYAGDRVSKHEVAELHLDLAREVYIVGELYAIDGTSHDAINMQTWRLINELYAEEKATKIPCHVMFEYQSTFSAFQFTDMKIEQSLAFRFIPFSIYENWAQQVLITGKLKDKPYYQPIDGFNGLPYSSHQRAHLIIVGMSKMGMALAVEAAHIAHYPNFNNSHAGRPRTLITFIDRNARREMIFFMGRFRELFQLARWRFVQAPDGVVRPADGSWNIYNTSTQMSQPAASNPYPWHDPLNDAAFGSPYYGGYLGEDFIDIDFEFIEGDVALPSIQKYITDACADCSANVKVQNAETDTSLADASSKTTIAVCFPVAAEAMSAALYFDASVYNNVQQIWVQQPASGALVDAIRYGLTGQDSAKFRALRPFGMIEQCDYLTHINRLLPKLVAFAYECMDPKKKTSFAEVYKSKSFDKFIAEVEENWLAIAQDGGKSAMAKRWSNIYCANSFETKIRAMGIDLSIKDTMRDADAIKELAKVEHNRWVIEQLLLGWRPLSNEYAEQIPLEDDKLRKTLKAQNIHPDLLSNEKLGSTSSYDEGIAKIIPLAMAIVEKYNK